MIPVAAAEIEALGPGARRMGRRKRYGRINQDCIVVRAIRHNEPGGKMLRRGAPVWILSNNKVRVDR